MSEDGFSCVFSVLMALIQFGVQAEKLVWGVLVATIRFRRNCAFCCFNLFFMLVFQIYSLDPLKRLEEQTPLLCYTLEAPPTAHRHKLTISQSRAEEHICHVISLILSKCINNVCTVKHKLSSSKRQVVAAHKDVGHL